MGRIMLHGDCLVNRAMELHRLFSHLLEQPDARVEVDMSATGRCDLSFFQLVCSACQSFAQRGKRLTLCAPPPWALPVQLEKIGLAAACLKCACDACLFRAAIDQTAQEDGKSSLPAS